MPSPELRPGGTHSGFSSLAKFCLNLRIELAPRSIWELSEAPLLCPPGKGPCSQRRKEEHGCPWHPSLGGTESGHDEQARAGSIQEAVKGRDLGLVCLQGDWDSVISRSRMSLWIL